MHRTHRSATIEEHGRRADRRSTRVVATVVSVLALGAAACSSSAAVTYNKAAVPADLHTAFNTLFNLADKNVSSKLAVIQNGSVVRGALTQGVNSSLSSASAGAKIDSYHVLTASQCQQVSSPLPWPCAKVVYDILGPSGTAVLPNSQGYAVFINGKWLVAKQTICGLLSLMYQTQGKAGNPPGC